MATIAQQLGEFVSQISVDNLPAEVFAKAKSCLLYGLGVAMAAHDSRQGQIAEAALTESETLLQGGATTILTGKKTTPGAAAFANGVSVSKPWAKRCLRHHGAFRSGGGSRGSRSLRSERLFRPRNFTRIWSQATKSPARWRKIISG